MSVNSWGCGSKAKLRVETGLGQQHPRHRNGTALEKGISFVLDINIAQLDPLKPGLFGEMAYSRSKKGKIQGEPKGPYWARKQGHSQSDVVA